MLQTLSFLVYVYRQLAKEICLTPVGASESHHIIEGLEITCNLPHALSSQIYTGDNLLELKIMAVIHLVLTVYLLCFYILRCNIWNPHLLYRK